MRDLGRRMRATSMPWPYQPPPERRRWQRLRVGKVIIDLDFLLLIAALAAATALLVSATRDTGQASTVWMAYGLLALIPSAVLHEAGHDLVARRQGQQVRYWRFGGVAAVEWGNDSDRVDAFTLFRVFLAGPMVNLVAAFLMGIAARLVGGDAVAALLAWIAFLNMLMFLVNIVPFRLGRKETPFGVRGQPSDGWFAVAAVRRGRNNAVTEPVAATS